MREARKKSEACTCRHNKQYNVVLFFFIAPCLCSAKRVSPHVGDSITIT